MTGYLSKQNELMRRIAEEKLMKVQEIKVKDKIEENENRLPSIYVLE